MISAFLLGGASTYGIYRSVGYFSAPSEPSFDKFLKFEDVRSTLLTVDAFLRKKDKKDYEQLRKQMKLIRRLLHDIDQLVQWRSTHYYRNLYYTGESKLIFQFKEEWMIFKVRIRVLSGLNYLELFN